MLDRVSFYLGSFSGWGIRKMHQAIKYTSYFRFLYSNFKMHDSSSSHSPAMWVSAHLLLSQLWYSEAVFVCQCSSFYVFPRTKHTALGYQESSVDGKEFQISTRALFCTLCSPNLNDMSEVTSNSWFHVRVCLLIPAPELFCLMRWSSPLGRKDASQVTSKAM